MSDLTELERLRRLEALDELLPTLAGVLDIRDVFARVSDIARRVLPHDGLGLPLLTEDREHVTPYALAGPLADGPIPERVPIPSILRELLTTTWEYRIIDDIQSQPALAGTPPYDRGFRGGLAVPIRLQGELVGILSFVSFAPRFFAPADVLIARRIADHVALALSHQRLAEAAARAAEARERAARLEQRVASLTSELTALAAHHRPVGRSPQWQAVLRQATQVAPTETTVLLQGESGTGKEVVARLIHRASRRRDGTFVAINCAALPDQLLESELFGYERGAFTGAVQAKPGQIELAAGGTLLLDEVGEMNAAAQGKLLRVLETHEFQRLGGTRLGRADIRVIAATNRDLQGLVARGRFREDLYYRLHVFGITLPALRDRKEDILPLSDAFLDDLSRSFGRPPAGISRDARDALVAHDWPGNVRELRNTLERAAILCDGGLITAGHLGLTGGAATQARRGPDRLAAPPDRLESVSGADPAPAARVRPGPDPSGNGRDAPEAIDGLEPTTDLWTIERALVKKALEDARFNKARAARTLGLSRTQLYVRLRRFGLS